MHKLSELLKANRNKKRANKQEIDIKGISETRRTEEKCIRQKGAT